MSHCHSVTSSAWRRTRLITLSLWRDCLPLGSNTQKHEPGLPDYVNPEGGREFSGVAHGRLANWAEKGLQDSWLRRTGRGTGLQGSGSQSMQIRCVAVTNPKRSWQAPSVATWDNHNALHGPMAGSPPRT